MVTGSLLLAALLSLPTMATMEDVFRSVRLQAPDVPAMLARRFVQDTYATLAARRGWNFLLKVGTIEVAAARSVVVDVTNGSATVLSAGLFLAADVGRQLRIGTGDIFTILVLTDPSTITLDRAYTGTTATGTTAGISSTYALMPADFARFDTLVDLVEQRRLTWWTPQSELNRIDPRRQTSGNPRLLSPAPLSAAGRIQYEWWPNPSSAANYPYRYFARPEPLADTTELRGVLAERLDVLEMGALARAAKWPGTNDHPNAYFSLPLARDLQLEFERLAIQLDIRDDDVSGTDWAPDDIWGRYSAWDYAANLTTLRATDAGIGEYLGGW